MLVDTDVLIWNLRGNETARRPAVSSARFRARFRAALG